MHIPFICSFPSLRIGYEAVQEFMATLMAMGLVILGLTWDHILVPGLPVGAVATWTFRISLVMVGSWPDYLVPLTTGSSVPPPVNDGPWWGLLWPPPHRSDWWNNSWELFLCWSAEQSIWNLEIGGLQRHWIRSCLCNLFLLMDSIILGDSQMNWGRWNKKKCLAHNDRRTWLNIVTAILKGYLMFQQRGNASPILLHLQIAASHICFGRF